MTSRPTGNGNIRQNFSFTNFNSPSTFDGYFFVSCQILHPSRNTKQVPRIFPTAFHFKTSTTVRSKESIILFEMITVNVCQRKLKKKLMVIKQKQSFQVSTVFASEQSAKRFKKCGFAASTKFRNLQMT